VIFLFLGLMYNSIKIYIVFHWLIQYVFMDAHVCGNSKQKTVADCSLCSIFSASAWHVQQSDCMMPVDNLIGLCLRPIKVPTW